MINEEIKFINDGYLYDQDEQKFYDVSGNIIIPEDRIDLNFKFELFDLFEKYNIKRFSNT